MKRVLAVGAHPDDVETGALGLLLSLKDAKIIYVALSQCSDIPRNTSLLAEHGTVTGQMNVPSAIYDLPNRYLHMHGDKVREILETYRDGFSPDTVVTSSPNDVHQDHRALAEEVTRTFKRETVLFYETPSACPYFNPRLFHVMTESDVERKLAIIALYRSQADRPYMSRQELWTTMRFRGKQCGAKYAEAFEVWRIIQ